MENEKTDAIISINDLKVLWRTFIKNWYIIFACIIIAFSLAYFYTYRLTDIYAASTQILLKSNDTYDSQSIIQGGYQPIGYKDYSENYNAMRIIKSYDLIKETINKLNLEVSYYIKGRLRTKELYENLPFKVEFTAINPLLYEQLIEFHILSPTQYNVTYLIGENQITKEGYFDRPLVSKDFNITVYSSSAIKNMTKNKIKEVDYLIQFHKKDYLIRKYQNAISLEIPEYSGIVQITLEDIIPSRAITFLDTLGKVYIDNTLNTRLDINSRTLVYIDKQLSELTEMMTSIEDRLQNYKQSEEILDLTKEEENYFGLLVSNQTELNRLEILESSFNSLEKYIIEDKDPEFVPPTIFLPSNDQSLTVNVNDLYALQMNKIKIKNSATETSPEFLAIEKELNDKKITILNYISNTRQAIVSQKQALKQQVQKYEGKISHIPMKQRELLNIERNLEVNQKMYSFLLQKKAENTIARAGIVPQSKIIESALSLGIVKPNKTKITYTFVGVGFLISLIIIAIRTSFYETIDTLTELKQKTNLTILGEVIHDDNFSNVEIALNDNPRSTVTESFRTLRTNLQFMNNSERNCQIYLLTSNHPSEGKTFCAVNLGALLARGERKVLILELDLHKPRVYKALGISNSPLGITSILVGKSTPEENITKTSVKNLDVMLSGTIAPNASELILSKNMQKIFDFGKQNYDYIIVDTPPVSLISDAFVLMKEADVNIFVMNTKYPYRHGLNHAKDIAETQNPKNFCLVLNEVRKLRNNYYYKRYGGSYHYYAESK
ncbi:MAG: polysaccharide biosynthesis tyrosine autokinase [Bacteroidia bacterium]|nr:polysaccharide biosynthesis tyrosine autokinase [Bacteroidia bacterium]MCZ2248326.1 polysaccharide biosynthesis tyrosine autokinase [Bacteroidia bacterium]